MFYMLFVATFEDTFVSRARSKKEYITKDFCNAFFVFPK